MGKKRPASTLPREDGLVACVAEIVREVLQGARERKDVNLNAIKKRLCHKYALDTSPRLVDIIAAVPQEHKKTLLPRLRAKPVRTASGVRDMRYGQCHSRS